MECYSLFISPFLIKIHPWVKAKMKMEANTKSAPKAL